MFIKDFLWLSEAYQSNEDWKLRYEELDEQFKLLR